eukprot:TRINITY_DN4505_c0_g1_i5.p1 TRINITY_DN4505_c0_g1~~TRINITY_DN4505_c0_g1_i5.p1  ORF type:complete len:150 (-),score=25.98 TRINITY_DN4505_c0_g1_i5:871-1320(-)
MSGKSRTYQAGEMGHERSSETKSVQENWDYEDLEESKEDTAACVRSISAHKMCIGLSLRKASENSLMAFVHTMADSTARERPELPTLSVQLEEKCRCQRDIELPCCVKARRWIMTMFDNKGIAFDHCKYKDQYLVLLRVYIRKFCEPIL